MYRSFSMLFLIGVLFSQAWALEYKAAEVYSADSFVYGKFETRFRTMKGGGLLSTFFLMNQDIDSIWRELDCEVFGKDGGTKYQSNLKISSSKQNEGNHSHTAPLYNDYHTYAIEWTPQYVAWYFDGTQIRKDTDLVEKFTIPMRIRFNAWPVTQSQGIVNWAGAIDQANIPGYQFINWIKYYKYTPGQGNNFTLSFTEDFDQLDTKKWNTATWGFTNNAALFSPANAVCKNGKLILCITKDADSGFAAGKTVPSDPTDPIVSVKSGPVIQNAPAMSVNYKNASLTLRYPFVQPQASTIGIYDCKGALLYTHTVKATAWQNSHTLSLSNIALGSGMHICRIKNDHFSAAARFTVQ
jgi:endo-1,3-1,4-beta-glycanase ExoK